MREKEGRRLSSHSGEILTFEEREKETELLKLTRKRIWNHWDPRDNTIVGGKGRWTHLTLSHAERSGSVDCVDICVWKECHLWPLIVITEKESEAKPRWYSVEW